MLAALRSLAAEMGCPSVAITFEPHPIQVLRPNSAPPLITTVGDRSRLILDTGVDRVFRLPVSPDLLRMSAELFFDQLLLKRFAIRGIVEGPNFMFGHGRGGNVDSLREMCAQAGVVCRIVSLTRPHGRELSSSVIRKCLESGQVAEAADLLGRTYSLTGTVIRGEGRGTSLGVPTANLLGVETIVPGQGVYAAIAETDGDRWPAAVSIGPNPTFGGDQQKLECHLLGFDGDLYGRELTIEFVDRLRDLSRFGTVDELRARIQGDIQRVRQIIPVPLAASAGTRVSSDEKA